MQFGPYFVADDELEWTFGPSGGPGGQHANRANTRATLRFDLEQFERIAPEAKSHMLARLGTKAPGGVLTVVVDETRSQRINRDIAIERMRQMLVDSLQRPRRRRPTRPTASSREKRLEEKRRQSERKANRRPHSNE